MFGNVRSEFMRGHDHETSSIFDQFLANVVTIGQHLIDQIRRFAQGRVTYMIRADDGKAAGTNVLGVERIELEPGSQCIRRHGDRPGRPSGFRRRGIVIRLTSRAWCGNLTAIQMEQQHDQKRRPATIQSHSTFSMILIHRCYDRSRSREGSEANHVCCRRSATSATIEALPRSLSHPRNVLCETPKLSRPWDT